MIAALGAYIWYETKSFSFIEIIFFSLGGVQVFLGLLAMSSKRSMMRVTCYAIILGFIFAAQIIATAVGFYYKSSLVQKGNEV